MSRLFYHVMQDNLGNLLFGVSGTMRLAGTPTAATIYGDPALTVILPNPMTNHPSFGSFKCYLGAGNYDFYMAKADYTFETLTGLQAYGTMAHQDAHAVSITGGTATLTDLTTTSTLEANGQVGINTPPDPLYALRVQGASYFGTQAGFGTIPSGSYSIEGVSALVSTLLCNSTLTVYGQVGLAVASDPLYTLKVNGAAYFISQVGFGVVPGGSYSLEASSGRFNTLNCSSGLGVTGSLDVTGRVGINMPSDPLYSLKVNGASHFVQQVGFGVVPSGSYSLEANSCLISTMTCNSSLDVTGRIAINTPVDPLYSLKVSGASYFATQVGFGTAPGGAYLLSAVSCLISTIDCNGTASKPGGGSWATYTSSAALKEQIAPLTGALDTVLRLQGKMWRWREEQDELERLLPGLQVGFVLEDIEQVMPQWLCHSLDGRKGYSETGMSALLVEAIRELSARVETLEARV